MTWLFTPPKSRRVSAALGSTILAAPLVVAAHFVIRLVRGDYPWNADAIAIPVFMFWIFPFPITLFFLTRGLRHYTPGVFLFTWARGHFWRSVRWTLLAIWPVGLTSIVMIVDGIGGKLYWVSAFFLLHCYCLLVLRASILGHDAPGAIQADKFSNSGAA